MRKDSGILIKPTNQKKSPLTQAKENMWSLMDLIKQHEKKPTGFGGVPWTHICIFLCKF